LSIGFQAKMARNRNIIWTTSCLQCSTYG